jgi:hypothetical protein
MRSCLARGLSDGKMYGEEDVQVEKHLCDECRPDGWVIFWFVSHCEGIGDPVGVNIRAADARRIGKALAQMADELDAR